MRREQFETSTAMSRVMMRQSDETDALSRAPKRRGKEKKRESERGREREDQLRLKMNFMPVLRVSSSELEACGASKDPA